MKTLPQELKSSKDITKIILNWVKASGAEGIEEILRGVSDEALQKSFFDNEKAWFSSEEDRDAVFNLPEMFEEGLVGSIIGGIAGIPGVVDSTLKLPINTNELREMFIKKLMELLKK